MYNIAIIGCGSIGKRYITALNNINNLKLNIYVHDLYEININDGKNILKLGHHNILDDLSYNIDIVAITTCSLTRYEIIKKLLSCHCVRYVILEKFMFPFIKQYDIDFGTTQVWINCPRRCYPYWRYIKDKINKLDVPYLYVYGSNWNMCSNSIHFIDVYGFIIQKQICHIFNKNINIFKSLRNPYDEFTGCIYNNNFCMISDDLNSINLVKIIFDSSICFIIINTKECIILIEKPRNIIKKFDHIFISKTMHYIFLDILINGNCLLTPYNESKEYHINFLKSISNYNILVS